jgi:hypothetical protein
VIKNHGSTRDYHLRRRYGIDSADFDRMMLEQDGLCGGCRKVRPERVDHDHVTGEVRGLLCFNCNQALGNARDDIYVMRGLIAYLDAYRFSMGGPAREEHDLRPLSYEYAGALHRPR